MIAEVLRDLATLKNKPNINQYAVDENTLFFEACRSLPSYIWWLIKRAPKIDGEKLLEVNDLLPKWDRAMHSKLIEMERKKFPGLIAPLVNKVSDFILKSDRPLILANFGFGGMEAERQIIEKILTAEHKYPVIFVGMDRSATTHKVAQENLKGLGQNVILREFEYLNENILKTEVKKNENKQYLVFFCKNNIFELNKCFPNKYFDAIYHALFKHHLNNLEKIKLDQAIYGLAQNIFEYDGFRNWVSAIPQTIIGWSDPVFLNAEIFSNLRYHTKTDIQKNHEPRSSCVFYKAGFYLSEKKYI